MAFSMFIRTPAHTSRLISQKIINLSTQPAFRCIASPVPVKNVSSIENKTPTMNLVRSLRTSSPMCSSEKGHDHAKLWVVERATSVALVPLIPLALMMPNKLFDSALAILITAHSFWGLEAIVVEYLRVLVVGPTVPKVAMYIVYCLTAIMLGGLFYLTFNGIGMCKAFWRVWRNMRKPKAAIKAASCDEGLEAVAVDYVRATIFGSVIPKIAIGLVYLISAATLGGLFYIIFHDIGVANTIRNVWSIKSQNKA